MPARRSDRSERRAAGYSVRAVSVANSAVDILRRDSSVPARFGLLIEASSKTDREGAGAAVAVPFGGEEATSPVGALRRWLGAAAIGRGASFGGSIGNGYLGPALSDRAMAEIVAARAAAAGLDGGFAGHSFGDFLTSVASSPRSHSFRGDRQK